MSVASESDFVGSLCLRLSQGVNNIAPTLLGYVPVITWPEQTASKPKASSLRMKLIYRNTLTKQTTLSQPPRFTTVGTFYAQIYAPASSAAARGLLLDFADAVAELYRGVSEPTGVWYRDIFVQSQPPLPEWISTRVGGKYQYDRYSLGASMPSSDGVGSSGSIAVYSAGSNVSGETALVFSADNTVVPADPTASEFVFAGVSLAAAANGASIAARVQGIMHSDTWNWVSGLPVFAGLNGVLTQTPPTSGWSLLIGNALDAVTLYVQPQDPVLVN